jgi:amino acid permease
VLLPVTVTVLACAAVLAVAAGVVTARDRRAGIALFVLASLTELAVLTQLVVGITQLASGHHDVSAALFVAYLLGLAVVVPLAVVWARGERSRWGPAVLAAAGLVVLVLMARLHQLWSGAGA